MMIRTRTRKLVRFRKEFVSGWHWEGNTLRSDEDTLEIYMGEDDMFHVRDFLSEQFLKESFNTLDDATRAATSRNSSWFYPEEFTDDILAPTLSLRQFKGGDLGELILLDLLYQNKHLYNSPEALAIRSLTENAIQVMDRIAPGKTPVNKAKAHRMATAIYQHYKALRPGLRRFMMIRRIKAVPEKLLDNLCEGPKNMDLGSFGEPMDIERKQAYHTWLDQECGGARR